MPWNLAGVVACETEQGWAQNPCLNVACMPSDSKHGLGMWIVADTHHSTPDGLVHAMGMGGHACPHMTCTLTCQNMPKGGPQGIPPPSRPLLSPKHLISCAPSVLHVGVVSIPPCMHTCPSLHGLGCHSQVHPASQHFQLAFGSLWPLKGHPLGQLFPHIACPSTNWQHPLGLNPSSAHQPCKQGGHGGPQGIPPSHGPLPSILSCNTHPHPPTSHPSSHHWQGHPSHACMHAWVAMHFTWSLHLQPTTAPPSALT
jgi:hypothetical protein